MDANHRRSWFARMVPAEVRSANRSSWHSLMRFSISPRAVDRLVETPGCSLRGLQRGDDEARIGLSTCPFRLADHAAGTAPAVQRRPGEVAKAPGRLTAVPVHGFETPLCAYAALAS